MFVVFWWVGRVGNNIRMDSPLLSRHLTLQNLRNINFLLMVHGSWLMAHGQGGPARPWGPRERRARRSLGRQGRAGPLGHEP